MSLPINDDGVMEIPAAVRTELLKIMPPKAWNLLASAWDASAIPTQAVNDAYRVAAFFRGLSSDENYQKAITQ